MKIATYMSEQPRAIVDGFCEAERRFGELGVSGAAPLTLVGSGSSLNCCLTAGHFIGGARIVPPVDFLAARPVRRGADEIVVVLTQSGASTTSIAAAKRAHDEGARAIVVTANAGGAAAALGLPTILMPIGDEPIGPKTKGYAASCAVLLGLAKHRGAEIAAPHGPALDEALHDARERASRLAPALDGLDYVLAAGTGAGYGTALEGSLKIAEIAGVPTAAFSVEETLHGRLHGATSASLVLPIVSDTATGRQAERIAAALAMHEVRVDPVPATASPALPEPWSMLAATFFFQALAVELCLRRGREPDLMRYPGLTGHLDIKTDATP